MMIFYLFIDERENKTTNDLVGEITDRKEKTREDLIDTIVN